MCPDEPKEKDLGVLIRPGMPVHGPDGELGHVYEVGDGVFAVEHGFLVPHDWKVRFREVERVDDRGVWLHRGRAALERVSDTYCGPTEPYRAAADASPVHRWTGFDPSATESRPDDGRAGPEAPERPTGDDTVWNDEPRRR